MDLNTEEYLDDSGLVRKKFEYDRRIHYGYRFITGGHRYAVIIGSLEDEHAFTSRGYEMPPGIAFPENGMAEVYFDVDYGYGDFGDFRHVNFSGLGSSVVLEKVSLAIISHYQNYDVGGFTFEAASGGVQDEGRRISLETTYDYLLGLNRQPRYNRVTGMPKKPTRSLLHEDLRAFKISEMGRATYVVL